MARKHTDYSCGETSLERVKHFDFVNWAFYDYPYSPTHYYLTMTLISRTIRIIKTFTSSYYFFYTSNYGFMSRLCHCHAFQNWADASWFETPCTIEAPLYYLHTKREEIISALIWAGQHDIHRCSRLGIVATVSWQTESNSSFPSRV